VSAPSPATIVVLEESAAAQDLIERTLRESGHRALITNDLLEVVELTRRVRIDLLVGDVLLLCRDQSVVEQIQRNQQDLRVLYVASRVEDGESTLHTPFSLEQLTDAVSAALGAAEGEYGVRQRGSRQR
jgi:DNA-binding response OmpR family regulator